MKKYLKKTFKAIGIFLAIPFLYLLISLIFSYISVQPSQKNSPKNHTIYLHTNGVHLDIALAKADLDSLLLKDLKHQPQDRYFSFGWGDRNFYLNTPTWGDLTAKNAVTALFLTSETLIHLTRYANKRTSWKEIKVGEAQLKAMNDYLLGSFKLDEQGQKTILSGKGYSFRDDFYEAIGSYSCFNTCNSWVNAAFKQCGVKACLWTPFDFALLNMHEN